MFERDYIMRIIREFTEALKRIIAHKEEGQTESALAEIARSANGIVGMTTQQLVLLPIESIIGLVIEQGEVNVARAAAVARLLKEHGEVLDQGGTEGGKRYHVKAFCLYDELEKHDPAELEPHRETMAWLLERLD